MLRRSVLALALAASCVLGVNGSLARTPAATAAGGDAGARDVEQECDPATPAQIVSPLEPDPGRPVVLSVLVLLDRDLPLQQAQTVMRRAAEMYAPWGLTLQTRFRRVAFEGTEAEALLAAAKKVTGGARPAGIDLVHTLTPVDLTDQGGNSLAGLADCIGGVRYGDRAYSISEVTPVLDDEPVGPVVIGRDQVASVVAHELGHLLGAKHEQANCAEGLQDTTLTNPCTIMTLAKPTSNTFGRLEAAVIRGYARAYAAP